MLLIVPIINFLQLIHKYPILKTCRRIRDRIWALRPLRVPSRILRRLFLPLCADRRTPDRTCLCLPCRRNMSTNPGLPASRFRTPRRTCPCLRCRRRMSNCLPVLPLLRELPRAAVREEALAAAAVLLPFAAGTWRINQPRLFRRPCPEPFPFP
jgi:hypothetical protein